MGMMKEFKEFAVKGNVIDMAVGIIIGAAFGKIVGSLVKDVIMPPIGMALGNVDFSELKIVLQEAVVAADGTVSEEVVAINYGVFINALIDFVILAFVIFMMVKAINSARRKEEVAPSAPPAPTKAQVLRPEIRAALRSR
jgi:large conductance mechanosensitive channel